MKKNILTLLAICTVMLSAIAGCGSNATLDSSSSNASRSTVFGVVTLDTGATSTVSVRDSSIPAHEKTAASSNGDYSVDVSGLKPPYIVKAEGTDQSGNTQVLYSISKTGGRANINPISDTAVTAAANETSGTALYSMRSSDDGYYRYTDSFEGIIYRLRTVLAPLFELYQISGNAVTDDDDDDENDSINLRALFNDVRFIVDDGRVVVKNRLTGGIIFSGSLYNLSAGTFYPENMPAGPGGGSTACTYTYSAWGACQSNGTQTRSMLTSSPAGCTGTPVLSQSCTYVPPTPTACTYTYGPWGACLSSGTQLRSLISSSPAGCTGTPILSQSCTYVPPVTTCTSFTYSAWGACQSNNTQTRTVLTSSPAGCTGGTPILSQACTYVPPVTTCTSFTYSAWGACQSNNTQTRTVLTSSPAGCTGGTPILSQACTYVPPTPVCGSCHAIPPATGRHTFHSSFATCATCHGTGYSSTTVNTATHANGVKDIVSTLNYNFTTRTCGSPGCHGSRTW